LALRARVYWVVGAPILRIRCLESSYSSSPCRYTFLPVRNASLFIELLGRLLQGIDVFDEKHFVADLTEDQFVYRA